jgi:hypothetical protein
MKTRGKRFVLAMIQLVSNFRKRRKVWGGSPLIWSGTVVEVNGRAVLVEEEAGEPCHWIEIKNQKPEML